ncbi:carbonic anhydrase 4 [Grammomys surdaster]|uniref:carbonic anhydrase 4 n=1 Tax=Grammomys surdaster TaxID=491861 RepID=UPI0010A060E8|nr:carbonic anhydrase 4 [Grammomys surdaster]
MKLFLALLALAYVAPSTEDSSNWCYEVQAREPNSQCLGPEQWTGNCKGENQSPINIVIAKSKVNSSLTPFTFVGYNQKKRWIIENNHNTVTIPLNGGMCILGGNLPGRYEAIKLHLHWSQERNRGSEHTIEGKRYDMEMHILHKKIVSGDKVQDSNDKYAVLAFMIQVSEKMNEGFQPLIEALPSISKPNSNTALKELRLEDMLPSSEKMYYYFRYQGSLTTPNCDETVIWTVFREPIKIHKDQFLEFSKNLYYDQDQKLTMKDNVRPLQKLGKRQVFRSHASGRLMSLPLPTLLVPTLTCLVASFLQ